MNPEGDQKEAEREERGKEEEEEEEVVVGIVTSLDFGSGNDVVRQLDAGSGKDEIGTGIHDGTPTEPTLA